MSKSTLRKRIALTATTALFAGMLSFVATPSATAAAGDTNLALTSGVFESGLYVATEPSTTGASIVATAGIATASAHTAPRSLGLLVKDASTGTAQTATILTGGSLSLYAESSTNTAFTASAGSLSGAIGGISITPSYNQTVTTVYLEQDAATTVGVRWTAPTPSAAVFWATAVAL